MNHHPAKVRLAALALNNLGISSIQHHSNDDEQAHKAFEDALTMLAAMVRSVMGNTVDTISSSSKIDTIMSKASSAVIDIVTENNNTCSSSLFQVVTLDDMAQTVQKLIQDGCNTSLPIFIRMEAEGGTLLEVCEYNEPTLETAVILYNFANAYQLQATTEMRSTQQRSKYLKRAAALFELALSVLDSNPIFGEIGINGCGLEPLAFSILALRGLVVACSTTNNASSPCAQEKYIQQLSALQEEFMSHEELITLFLDSSSRLAPAA